MIVCVGNVIGGGDWVLDCVVLDMLCVFENFEFVIIWNLYVICFW